MNFFLDTEFNTYGSNIIPISLGLVNEKGSELYIEFNPSYSWTASDWVKENVVPHLKWNNGDYSAVVPNFLNARELITEFVSAETTNPNFYTWYGSYDWVMFAGIFGNMTDLPKGFPMYTRDLKHLVDMLGIEEKLLPKQIGTEHNALEDARWNKEVFDFLVPYLELRQLKF
ncbi:MAG: 3'-5' exoribonuclease [Proteobacteria bacterium]|nr:3'-5' exoribonuclease [Pseudomonadota bacterium]